MRALGLQSAADEVDDFEAVAIFEDGFRPDITGGDFAVEFDGDAVGLHVEGFDQGRQRELGGRRRVSKSALFSIDVKFHFVDFLTPGTDFRYSLLRRANLRVTVRPSWLAWTMTEESGSEDSSTSMEMAALPVESVTAWV